MCATWIDERFHVVAVYFGVYLLLDLRLVPFWWLDDILIHSQRSSNHLHCIQQYIHFCLQYNSKFHPPRSVLLFTIIWCCIICIISSDNILSDERRIVGTQQRSKQKNDAELPQFVCGMQWTFNAIPEFSSISRLLYIFLEWVHDLATAHALRYPKYLWTTSSGDQYKTMHSTNAKLLRKTKLLLAHCDIPNRLSFYTNK